MPKYINDEYQNIMIKTWNVEQQSINQLMSIETHRHFKSTNISKYGTKINKIMQQMHKHKTK